MREQKQANYSLSCRMKAGNQDNLVMTDFVKDRDIKDGTTFMMKLRVEIRLNHLRMKLKSR